MRKGRSVTAWVFAGTVVLLAAAAWADRWDVRHEATEGAREIRHEREEAVREISKADSPWEARHEIREAHREINHERREARREVRREVNQNYWRW